MGGLSQTAHSRERLRKVYKQGPSDLESAKVGDANSHHVQVHFDEVVLYAARFGGGEDFLPIQSVLADRHHFFGFRRPALQVHGKEAAGVLREILRGVVATADGGDLELELDELGIEKFQQQVIGPLTINHRELKVLIMKTLLDTSLGRQFSHFVVFVGRALDIIHSRFGGAVEAGHDHLRQADIFGPGNAGLLILAEFLDAEVRTHTGDARIAQNFPELVSGVFGEAAEAELGVTYRRAQFNGLKSGNGKLLDGAGKVLGNHLPDGPGLAPNGHAKRVGAKLRGGQGKKSGSGGAGRRISNKLSSRNLRHRRLPSQFFARYWLPRISLGLANTQE